MFFQRLGGEALEFFFIGKAPSPGFFIRERVENLRGNRVLLIPRKRSELFERRL